MSSFEEPAFISSIRRFGKYVDNIVYYKFVIEWSEDMDGKKIHTFYFKDGKRVKTEEIDENEFQSLFFDYGDFCNLAKFYHPYFLQIREYLEREMGEVTYFVDLMSLFYIVRCGKCFNVFFSTNEDNSISYQGVQYGIGELTNWQKLDEEELKKFKKSLRKLSIHDEKIFTSLSDVGRLALEDEKLIIFNGLIFSNCASTLFEDTEEFKSAKKTYEVIFTDIEFIFDLISRSITKN